MERSLISFILYETASITLQIISVIFNMSIICTLSKKSLIRCPSNKFVFSLCMSHLLVSILTLLISAIQFFGITENQESILNLNDSIPISKLNSSSPEEEFKISMSFILSHILLYLTLTAVIGTSINVALISVERYITIAHPMKYKSIVTPGRCTTIILICWTLPALAVPLPMLFSGNQTVLHGSFAMPNGRLGLYYAIVFLCVTFVVLSIMILCYLHIFMIAKAKCQKVQIGHFTSPVSSISSDWPSTAYSSQAEGQPTSQLKCSHSSSPPTTTNVQRLSSPNNSLLQYVLLANLGKYAPPRVPCSLTINDINTETKISTITQKTTSTTSTTTTGATDVQSRFSSHSPRNDFHHHQHQQHDVQQPITLIKPRKWKTFLKQNYNSPKKTISTIVILIGSLILTQFPISIALFFPSQGFTLFYFCFKHLVPFSSLTNPILYGFLNRTIRFHLLKFLKIKRKHRKFILSPRNMINGRRASISSADSHFLKREISLNIDDEDKISIKSCNATISQPYNNITNICNNNDNNGGTIVSLYPNPLEQFDMNPKLCNENNTIQGNQENTNGLTQVVNNTSPLDSFMNNNNHHQHLKTFLSCGNNSSSEVVGDEPTTTKEKELGVELGESNDLQASNFPRKPSQDSGVDVTFSEDEEEGDEDDKQIEYQEQSNVQIQNIHEMEMIETTSDITLTMNNVITMTQEESRSSSSSIPDTNEGNNITTNTNDLVDNESEDIFEEIYCRIL